MRILVTMFLAVACGLGVGFGTAVLKIRQYPWKGGFGSPASISGGKVEVDQEEFDFGKMDSAKDGKHEFTISNRGDHPLALTPGSTSCSCTLSEIKDDELAPGQSTKVVVSWRSKGRIGPFRQSATIVTSDPLRPEIIFTIRGEYTRSVYAEPDELVFGQIPGNEPVTRETRIFSNLPNQQIEIQGYQMSDPSLEKFFQVDHLPLSPDELRKYKGAMSGALVRVTAKPGLPLGRFQQRILLSTNLATAGEVEIPLFGSIGEVSLVGTGWNSETNVWDIGTVDGRTANQRKLVLLARGSNAKQIRFKITSVEPDFLKVKLGNTIVADTGLLSQTELLTEIPESKNLKRKVPVNYLGGENRKLGEILVETTQPQVQALRIRIRFAIVDGS